MSQPARALLPAPPGQPLEPVRVEAPEPRPSALHLPVLDGFRALCIGLVLASHVNLYQAKGMAWVCISSLGALGVACFFVLSGFLITTLLLREEARAGTINLRAFYVRRALRILPAYFCFVGTVFLLDRLGLLARILWHDYAASAVFVRNLVGRAHETAHLWSVSIEEQFYLCWPLTFLLLPRGGRLRFLGAVCVAVLLWRGELLFGRSADAGKLYLRTDVRIDNIMVGCALAVWHARRRAGDAAASGWLALGAVGFALVAGVYDILSAQWSVFGYSLIALAITLVLRFLVLRPESWVARRLSNPALGVMGRLSYSLYLWQQLFLGPVEGHLVWIRSRPVVGLACSVLAAVLSYRLIERPFLALKERFSAPA